ncbi:MAG: class IV adenylate cyclase [Bacilli bacterium]|nr:class IV adenylate cyclase [Bacilli bacterium]
MREIELKFQVDNFDKIKSILDDNNEKLSEEYHQSDTIYVSDLNDTESKEGSIWLRVRKVNDKIEMNLKKQSAKKMESEEIEFEVSDYFLANKFLSALGYKEWVQVNKKRVYSKYDDVNICMDEVERLGYFIELELLIDENDEKDYESILLDYAKKLGIDTDRRINSHYDTMISELDK